MSDLSIIQDQALTMSSLEISTLVESRHDKVRQSIERLAERGIFTLPPLGEVSNPGPGPKTIGIYNLDKRSSLIVVAQLCPEFTARIVDRWQELEAQIAKPVHLVPQSLPEALRLAADLAEQKAKSDAALAIAAPKAEALDRIAAADGSNCITDAAKVLQIRPKDLFSWLQSHQWIYRRQGCTGWLAYQQRIQQGYLEHKVTTVERGDGSERVVESVRVTRRGLARLAEAFAAQPKAA